MNSARLIRFLPAVFSAIAVFVSWCAQSRAIEFTPRIEKQAAEQEYWRKAGEADAKTAAAEEHRKVVQRQEAIAALGQLETQGASIQADLIRAEIGLPEADVPSLFDGKRDYIMGGFAAVLFVVVTISTMVRHRREAEIRALTGGYLSDGTEVARMAMPDWFVSCPAVPMAENLPKPEELSSSMETPAHIVKFFQDVPPGCSMFAKL